jgi:cell division septation protein DedD
VASKETGAAKAADTDNSEKVKKISKESPPPNKMEPLPKRGFYSIKIMALRDPEKAQEFMESQKKKGLDIHSRTITIQDQGLWHQILWGHFGSRNEAQRFLEENKILQLYPGSTIIKLSR